jgi:hypothetical protein
MTYIDPESALRMNVVRLVTTKDSNGDTVGEAYNLIYGEHWADVQPLSDSERTANAQLKISATHKIYPEPHVDGVLANDFYREVSNGKLYRIVDPFDYRTLNYFKVWEGGFANPETPLSVQQVRYVITGVGPGVYLFGSGLFASVPIFSTVPVVYGIANNDCDFHIASITNIGFMLVDDNGDNVPVVTVFILGTV